MRQAPRRPRLSVVIPAYNVETHLAECLDSVLAQQYEPLEVLVIDDGSTDGTATVARRFADTHGSVRVVATPNHGPGAARNRGVAETSGELIAFVDSDDVVAPHAYDELVGALERSGSDFATGSMRWADESGHNEPDWMRRLHTRERLGITADDYPDILGDAFGWNKVFRRSFWERERLSFAEGSDYEDQVTVTHAYLIAASFDVIAPVVYDWRSRSGKRGSPERPYEVADLRSRVHTKRSVLQAVRVLGTAHTYETFRDRVLPSDMWRYFAHIPGCSDEYWAVLHAAVREFWRGGGLARSGLTVRDRLAGWLVGHDRRREAEAVVAYANEYGDALPTVAMGDGLLATLPFWEDPEAGIPLELYRLRPDELGWTAELTDLVIEGDALVVRGRVHLRAAGSVDALARIVLSAGDGTEVCGPRTPTDAVEARFDLHALVAGWPLDLRDAPRVWRADVRWESHAMRHDGPFTAATANAVGTSRAGPLASTSVEGTYVDVAYAPTGLRIVAHPLGTPVSQRTA